MEATIYQDDVAALDFTPAAAITGGQVVQLPCGRAAVCQRDIAAGVKGAARVRGIFTVAKTADINLLDGQKVYWDHSANTATYAPASDRDFLIGCAVGDSLAAATTVNVNLNVLPHYKIDLHRDEFLCVPVKTVVGSTTVEVPHLQQYGGATRMLFGATAEAQKLDLLSGQGFALASNWIAEGAFNVLNDGDAAAIDFNIGVANGTHDSDADAITESVFLHLDGNALDLLAESDDGTTEVNATDTTVNIALGTPVRFVIDGRDPSDIQIYVNGVLVLGSTVFTLAAATGPLKLLAHLEKSSDDTVADYRILDLCVRTME